jgi:hypothetical protein
LAISQQFKNLKIGAEYLQYLKAISRLGLAASPPPSPVGPTSRFAHLNTVEPHEAFNFLRRNGLDH